MLVQVSFDIKFSLYLPKIIQFWRQLCYMGFVYVNVNVQGIASVDCILRRLNQFVYSNVELPNLLSTTILSSKGSKSSQNHFEAEPVDFAQLDKFRLQATAHKHGWYSPYPLASTLQNFSCCLKIQIALSKHVLS